MKHKKITIVAKGKTEDALDLAIEEAMSRIHAGCTSGADQTDDGSFYFEASDNVPRKEQSR